MSLYTNNGAKLYTYIMIANACSEQIRHFLLKMLSIIVSYREQHCVFHFTHFATDYLSSNSLHVQRVPENDFKEIYVG